MFWFIAPPHEIVGRSLRKPRRPRAATGRRHPCAMVGQHRPASPGWRRRRGAAHPASGRLVRPGRMPPTMGSRLRREVGAGQRRCPGRCQQRARRCACRAGPRRWWRSGHMAVWHFVAWAGSNRSQPGRWMLYPRPTTVLVAGSIACRMSERDSHATHQALGVDKRCRTTWQRYVERRAKQRRRAEELVVEQLQEANLY